MALRTKLVWGHIQRPWGYEVRCDFEDSDTLHIHNDVVMFAKEPKETKDIDVAVEATRVALEARIKAESDAVEADDAKVLTDTEKQSWSVVESKVLEYVKAQVSDSAVSKEDAIKAEEYLAVIEAALKSVATADKATAVADEPEPIIKG